jgi:hypothetical protein
MSLERYARLVISRKATYKLNAYYCSKTCLLRKLQEEPIC